MATTEIGDTLPKDDPILEAASVFGIPYLYPWQRLVIANILDAVEAEQTVRERKENFSNGSGEALSDRFDEDGVHRGRQIVLLPTGAGKSLCFQLPALLLQGPTLVIYPLLALQGDQQRRLSLRGIEAAVFRGGQSPEERKRELDRLEGRDGKPPAPLIIANPEVLEGQGLLERIRGRNLSHVAIDEAHCVTEWGDSFRPAYLGLGELIEMINPPAVTAFTATASPVVLGRVAEILFRGRAHLVRGESDRPNIRFSVNPCFVKEAALLREAARRKRPMIVFCSTRGGTERVATMLQDAFPGMDCRFYHAGLAREEKSAVEAWFRDAPEGVLAATCAWGMGIDMPNVRTVLHRDPPPTVESYIQEAGRAGRDGNSAEAVLLWSPLDRLKAERTGNPLARSRALKLADFAENETCRRISLLTTLGDPRTGKDAPGGEQTVCSGCDLCDGTALRECGDLAAVRSFIERNPGRYGEREAEGLLYEGANRTARKELGFPAWRRSDMGAMISWLLKTGELSKVPRRPAWFYSSSSSDSSSSVFSAGALTATLRRRGAPAGRLR